MGQFPSSFSCVDMFALRRVVTLCWLCSATLAYVIPAALPAPRQGSRLPALTMEQGVETMPVMMPKQKSWMPKAEDRAMSNKKWYVVDAEGLRLGRMSSEIAKLLLGKHKPTFTQGVDVGDYVIVVNADKVIVTGNKASQKLYRRHSGRPGGMKTELYKDLQQRIPERIVEKAIKGMLPKNSHGRELFRHLKVYKGDEHPHAAQSPEPIFFGGLTSMKDSKVLELSDPDAVETCAA